MQHHLQLAHLFVHNVSQNRIIKVDVMDESHLTRVLRPQVLNLLGQGRGCKLSKFDLSPTVAFGQLTPVQTCSSLVLAAFMSSACAVLSFSNLCVCTAMADQMLLPAIRWWYLH
jgi:hypothetical protein